MTDAQKDLCWVQNIIDSCNNDFHFIVVDSMITLFEQKHNNQELTTVLQLQRQQHWNAVHGILI